MAEAGASDAKHNDESDADVAMSVADATLDDFAPAAPVAETVPAPPLWGFLLLFSCVVIWGVNAVAFKYCTNPPHGAQRLDPVFLTGLRFLIVAPCMALMIATRRPDALRLAPGDWWRFAGFGFLAIVMGETLQPLAYQYTSVANVTFLSHGTLSLFVALWAWLLLKNPITRTGWIGAAIALAGVGIVASHGRGGGLRFDADSWRGDGIAVFRSVEHSAYMLALARWLRVRSVLQVTVYNCAFGALWLLPYVIWRGWTFPWAAVPPLVWWAFAWTVVPTTLYGFLAWNYGLRVLGAVAGTNMFYLMPVAAVVAAWAILGEPLSAGQIFGGFVIVVGIVLLRWDTLTNAGLTIRLPQWLKRALP